MIEKYLKLYEFFNSLLEYYEKHHSNLIYVALVAIRTELTKLYNKIQSDEEPQTKERDVPPPPPSTIPPPP